MILKARLEHFEEGEQIISQEYQKRAQEEGYTFELIQTNKTVVNGKKAFTLEYRQNPEEHWTHHLDAYIQCNSENIIRIYQSARDEKFDEYKTIFMHVINSTRC